jgi:fumarate reductase flavoprotein subunit
MHPLDICIIGGGFAGLTVAARLGEMGHRAVVLEQGEETLYPCNSRFSGGTMHLAFLDMGLDPNTLAAGLLAKCPPDLNRPLIEAIGRNSQHALAWLRTSGAARFVRFGSADWQRWCLAPVRPRRPGLIWRGTGTDAVMRGLERTLLAHGNAIWRGARVEAVERRGDGRFDIVHMRGGARQTLTTTIVVLAEGGFQGNSARVGELLAPEPESILARHAGTGRGLALAVAQALDLAVTPVHRFYGHLVSADAKSNPRLWPWPTLDELATGGLVVDASGTPQLGRSTNGVAMANMLARRSDGRTYFTVFDDRAWQTIGTRTRVVPCNPCLELGGARIFRGNTIEELAAACGIVAAPLVQSVAALNAAMDRPAIAQPPYYAIPTIAGLTYTMSGLETDAQARVRLRNGEIIDSLYAVGGSAGGAEGGESTFYLGGISKAVITGLIAAETIATQRA